MVFRMMAPEDDTDVLADTSVGVDASCGEQYASVSTDRTVPHCTQPRHVATFFLEIILDFEKNVAEAASVTLFLGQWVYLENFRR